MRQSVATLMKAHPGWTNALQGTQIYVSGQYVKPAIEKVVIKEVARAGAEATGVDQDELVSYITIANDGSKVIQSHHALAKVPEGRPYETEIKTRKAIKTTVGETAHIMSEIEKLKEEKVVSTGGGGGGSW